MKVLMLDVDGVLVPNTELGHLEIDGHDVESRASDAAREREELSWTRWAKRLNKFYTTVEMLFSPDLFVVGGGVSNSPVRVNNVLDPAFTNLLGGAVNA